MLKLSKRIETVKAERHLSVRLPGNVDAVVSRLVAGLQPQKVYSKTRSETYGGHLEHIFERA